MKIDRTTLASEHVGLAGMATELRQAVEEAAPDFEQLARARWHLGYLLAIHLAKEDKHVYPALKAHPDPRIASLVAALEQEMSALDQKFRDYLAGWNVAAILQDWPAFRGATLGLLELLERRIDREEQELYPLL